MLLSVVMPVHRVQGYLRAALESVTGRTATDGPVADGAPPGWELIAVEAGTRDGGLNIAREFAERDPRVRVLPAGSLGEHPEGAARNAGAAEARGDYLLFLDGDDLLLPGALAAVAGRLAEDRPDVLRLGHDLVDWWGVVRPGDGTLPAARNQLFRRAFWAERGLRFTDGPYDDVVPVHRAALLASDAGTLAVLDQVCVRHRLRRTGTFATTPGRAHFAIIDAYARLAAATGDDPRVHALRTAHLEAVLEDPGRIAPGDRSAFFRAAALPGRYASHRTRETVRAQRTRALTTLGAGRKALRTRVMRAVYRTDRHRSLDPHLAVYGAYWNRGVACNPAAVHAKARELAPHIRGVWAVSSRHLDRMPPGVPYVIEGSRAYWRAMATATYLVNNSSFPGGFTKRPGQVYLQTHHGTPLKTMGLDQLPYPALTAGVSYERILAHADQWDLSLTANPHTTEVWDRVYPARYEHLAAGYPRNDVYFTATPERTGKIRAELGIAPGRTVLLYAPTHRDYRKGFVPHLDPDRLARELGEEYVLLVRAHYFYGRSAGRSAGERTLDVTGHPSVEELCLASDALITDYSSLMFDYACLDRPIITYAPDWAAYRAARGTYIDLLSGRPGDTPGAVATTQDELREVLLTGAWRSPEAAVLRTAFRERFCPYDDGHAAERVVRRLFSLGPE
ncbi:MULTISPECIES: CDP-glycerol:glycerophosphate glycerophosphotransferase [unclassified Streptomyces]|uniref:CDP-glycerol:glycerophosphate glycerophosphotransferase n=1 Tax=unclassified Streptomyces TaxID=2593676 RepID=UPI0001C1B675|nr:MULTISPECIES: CDP-glycerol:glycerophosphate glycerophosphotransferase [unclassified Streptomyces]AEN10351.1 CDP-glycerol:poly(glycerophosphate) glycerophosphotransferase [Streptomyces sp. SirexAA-E]MYR65029.1 glycosyltransferase [Streptomyces sp. SID4939]MYS02333.1 glycosyltransferase [Streptomyces sp. SID4940]MYT65502.1 glycosyltransferase [Streptomyces sp. SID8357]MYT84557.1 glycosyltransferase [Streptomyces sp. SID8360]